LFGFKEMAIIVQNERGNFLNYSIKFAQIKVNTYLFLQIQRILFGKHRFCCLFLVTQNGYFKPPLKSIFR